MASRPVFKLRLTRPGQPTVERSLPGPEITIGRAEECDFVVNEPHVSKRHLRLLHGLVAVDEGSSNGTLHDGLKMDRPIVLEGGGLLLGSDDILLEVSVEVPAPAADPAPVPVPAPKAAPAPGADTAELATLRERVEELERENRELKRSREEAPPPPSSPMDLFASLQKENRELADEVERLERRLADQRIGGKGPAGVPAASPVPVPAKVPFPGFGSAGATAGLWKELVDGDDENRPPVLDGPLEDFMTVESFRIVRKVEKVVTRIAGEFIQLLQARTILPGMAGNFRGLASDVFAAPDAPESRRALVEYLEHLRRWLVVALGAYRKASVQFATELKHDLTEPELTAKLPVPTLKKIIGRSDAELWHRARSYLDGLKPELIEERIDDLARGAAQELLD